ncbi:MAG: endonuclease/exonuclease/phosphatase family protein [Kiloniellales bacterium]|nr:endonuclease/exonuclease/phosphatase family protein [Kiloniellales bacterium]
MLPLVLLSLAACALGPWLSCARAEGLEVIQYNVQFVAPWDFSRASPKHYPNTEERARAIGRALACFDIVALNETINDRRRRQILAAMESAAPACGKPSRFGGGHSFQLLAGPSLPPAARGWPSLAGLAAFATSDVPMAVTDDEVAIVTRLPVIASGSRVFGAARGTDALTAKGVLHARLGRGGRSAVEDAIEVFVTHLQANHAEIRRRQIVELATFIEARADPRLPALLFGDFNVDGSPAARADPEGEYQGLMRRLAPLGFRDLGLALGGTDSWERRRIDYIFLRGPGIRVREAGVETFGSLPYDALSDHAAVTAALHWPRPAGTLPNRGDDAGPEPRPGAGDRPTKPEAR